MVITSADVPLKGLVHLLEAVAKLRTERPVRLTVVGTARPGGPPRPRSTGSGCATPSASPAPCRRPSSSTCSSGPRSSRSRRSTRVSPCRRSRRWPARPRWSPPTPAPCPRSSARRPGCGCRAGDVGELTAALQLVLDSPALAERLGRAGRQRVLEPTPGGDRAAHRRLVRRGPGPEGDRPLLTVDYDRLDVRPGMTVLDLGCGEGRHAFEAYRRGAHVVALDWGVSEVDTTRQWLGAIAEAGEAPAGARPEVVRGDLARCPYPTPASTGSSPPRSSSTSRTTPPRSPRSPACSSPAGGSPSRSRATGPSGSAGRCRTSTTPTRAGTPHLPRAVRGPAVRGGPRPSAATTRTPCTRRTGG